MTRYRSHADPPTLVARLERLNEELLALGDRLKAAIGSTIGDAVADAIRDAFCNWLGTTATTPVQGGYLRRPTARGSRSEEEEDDPWYEDDYDGYDLRPGGKTGRGGSWPLALAALVQAGVAWVRQLTAGRPGLTAVLATLATGVVVVSAGPFLGAGAGVVATIAGLLLAADTVAGGVGGLALAAA